MNNDMIIKEILQLREDVDEIKYVLKTQMATKKDFEALLEGQDYILGILKNIQIELVSMKHAIQRHEELLIRR